MQTLVTHMRADASAQARTLRTFALIAALLVAGNIAMERDLALSAAGAVASLTGMLLAANLFGEDEQSHLSTLYSVLPVSRAQVVVSRYLEVVALVLASALLGLVLTLGAHALPDGSGLWQLQLSLSVTGMGVCAAYAVAAVQMPLFFALGSSRTGMYSQLATMTVLLGSMAVANRAPGLVAGLGRLASTSWAGAAAVGASLAAMALSAIVSCALYSRRDL
ncbi:MULTISPECIES: ABC-2 transporter permease [unclassified Actinomyces]|uniref:ABC-2 transporter permease n=1 Tax=unclassified Actinomyces TaxID=2609248 RepID=UPI002016DBEF|nr:MULTISPECIES: ABC-2 transporter permease [unclassified Actinomyces]MCL3778023.1 ABC-2 transporter permease [Actinomyces sp. AC-20-1]MCL3789986.1 ABC-2 transporter permease [Actinomyces sp. 187325]MCL3791536.1 ABC-2 transporter permease [Actinomyces sp. 186855]MCL3793811.1 ABC-2 transporter permease [Actinomyces sp. 217892]